MRNPYKKANNGKGVKRTVGAIKKRRSVPKIASRLARKDLRTRMLDDNRNINPMLSTGERMFNKEGSLNAYDKRDAIAMIHRLLNDTHLGKVRSASYRKESDLKPEERREILIQAFKSDDGIRKLGEELLAPIKNVLDYEGWARKILRIKEIGQGEIHRISKDIYVVAFIVGQDGQSVSSQAFGSYIYPSEFKVTAFPEVDIQDIYQMNFDVLERQQDLAKQMIMLKEDKALVSALDQASTAVNDVVYFSTFNIGTFEDIRYQVERHRLIVDKFIVNRQEINNLIKNMHNYVDIVTERELILMGYIGNVLGTQIITTAGTGVQEVVPAGSVYVVTQGSFLGEMGIRLDLQSEQYNKFNQQETKKGWMFLEIIDQAIANPRSVAKGVRI